MEVLSTISITTPSLFNQNGLTAVPVYYPSNPIKAPFTGKNDKVIFHDHCNCEAEDLGGNTYQIQTTTGYLSSTGGNIIKTTDVVGTKTPSQPDTSYLTHHTPISNSTLPPPKGVSKHQQFFYYYINSTLRFRWFSAL